MHFDNRYVTCLQGGGKLVFDGTATPSSTPDYSEVCVHVSALNGIVCLYSITGSHCMHDRDLI